MTDSGAIELHDDYGDAEQIFNDPRVAQLASDYLSLKAAVREYFGSLAPRNVPELNAHVRAEKELRELAFDHEKQEPTDAE